MVTITLNWQVASVFGNVTDSEDKTTIFHTFMKKCQTSNTNL